MKDVFISYSRKDADKAAALAEVFAQKGLSVWWDRSIPLGKAYDAVIEDELSNAKAVIVLWSNDSVNSDWVRAEAEEGLTRHVLIPVLIARAKVPLRFRQIQAADLSDWDGRSAHVNLDALLKDVSALTSVALLPVEATVLKNNKRLSLLHLNRRSKLILAGCALLVILLASYYKYQLHLSGQPPVGANVTIPHFISEQFVSSGAVEAFNLNDLMAERKDPASENGAPLDVPTDDVGGGKLKVSFFDVYGRRLRDKVNIVVRNLRTDKGSNSTGLDGSKDILFTNLVLAPQGLYKFDIDPDSFYPTNHFATVRGELGTLRLVCPVYPPKVRTVSFPSYVDLPKDVQDLLERSRNVNDFQGKAGKELYGAIGVTRRANLFNVIFKIKAVFSNSSKLILFQIRELREIGSSRVWVSIKEELRNAITELPEFQKISKQPDAAPSLSNLGSYKTLDKYGSLQIAFFAGSEGNLAELSIDAQGAMPHLFQGLREYTDQTVPHPFDVHQILVFYQKLDPGYLLIP